MFNCIVAALSTELFIQLHCLFPSYTEREFVYFMHPKGGPPITSVDQLHNPGHIKDSFNIWKQKK